MLTVLLYSAFVLWVAIAIVALVVCDVSARRDARVGIIEARRGAGRRTARAAIGARGF